MIKTNVKIRVRYAETDKMGFVYYGNYATYFEVARTELLRSIGLTYKELESVGVMLPVVSYEVKYKAAAQYDDLLNVRVLVKDKPTGVRIKFEYEVYCAERLITTAITDLIFVESVTKKPIRIPTFVDEILNGYFK